MKKLRRKKLKPPTFPGGVKFARFSSLDNLEKSLEVLKAFLEKHVVEKPLKGTYIIGSNFLKFVPETRSLRDCWQVSTIYGKYVTLYSFNDTLGVFTSQTMPDHPDVRAVISKYGTQVQVTDESA